MSEEKLVSIYNKGGRVFRTSRGPLAPDAKLLLPEAEAKALLCYPEVIETGKMSARDSRTISQLREENAKLKAELESLKKKDDKDEKSGGKPGK